MDQWCRQEGADVFLKIWLQPGAKKIVFRGIYYGAIKLSVQGPPVDGKANRALVDWIISSLKVKRNEVILTKGFTSRLKTVVIKNASLVDVSGKLMRELMTFSSLE